MENELVELLANHMTSDEIAGTEPLGIANTPESRLDALIKRAREMCYNMAPASLAAWIERLNLNKSQAASALGIARNTLDGYLNGSQPIPKYIGLACAAIAHGLPAID